MGTSKARRTSGDVRSGPNRAPGEKNLGAAFSHFKSWRTRSDRKKLRVLAGYHHELPAAAKEPITPLRRQRFFAGFAAEGAVSLQRELLSEPIREVLESDDSDAIHC